jgi:hypothetical protein
MSNPRPTHYEADVPDHEALYQHREHHSQHSGRSMTSANALRHARIHASDRGAEID